MLIRLILLLLLLTLPLQAQSDLEFIWNKDGFGGLFDRGPQIAYSPDGTRLVAGDVEGTIRILSMPDGEILHEVKYPDRIVNEVNFAPDGKYIAVLLEAKIGNSTILMIDPLSGGEVHKMDVERWPPAFSLRYSSGSQLLVLGASAYVKLLSVPELNEVWRFDYQSSADSFIKQADISFNNELIAIGLTDRLMIVERESKKEFELHREGSVQELQFIPNSEELLVSWDEATENKPSFASFDVRSGKRTPMARTKMGRVPKYFELSPGGRFAIGSNNNAVFFVQELNTQKILMLAEETGAIDFALPPDSMYIALGRGRGQLSLIRSPWNRVNTDVHDPATHSWDFTVTPNPAEAEVTISFTVPAAGAAVKLELYNLPGQLLHQLLDDFLPAGEQHLRITAAELVAKGTNVHQLFCSLTMQNKTQNMLIYLGH